MNITVPLALYFSVAGSTLGLQVLVMLRRRRAMHANHTKPTVRSYGNVFTDFVGYMLVVFIGLVALRLLMFPVYGGVSLWIGALILFLVSSLLVWSYRHDISPNKRMVSAP